MGAKLRRTGGHTPASVAPTDSAADVSTDQLATPVSDLSEIAASADGATPAPTVDFVGFDGTSGSTADFSGTSTVVNFWQSYCTQSVAEMSEFEAVNHAANDLAAETGVTCPLADDLRIVLDDHPLPGSR